MRLNVHSLDKEKCVQNIKKIFKKMTWSVKHTVCIKIIKLDIFILHLKKNPTNLYIIFRKYIKIKYEQFRWHYVNSPLSIEFVRELQNSIMRRLTKLPRTRKPQCSILDVNVKKNRFDEKLQLTMFKPQKSCCF